MGYGNYRFQIYFAFTVLIFFSNLLFSEEVAENSESNDPFSDYHPYMVVDVPASSKGGGTLSDSFSHFIFNPSSGIIKKHYSVSALYLNPDAFSLGVYDSKTQSVAGGFIYRHTDVSDEMILNIAFPLGQFLSMGANFKRFTGDIFTFKNDLTSYNLDLGVSIFWGDMFKIGASFTDVIALSGEDLPKKVNFIGELNFFQNMLNLNTGINWHVDHSEEIFIDNRKQFKHMDVFGGLSLRYKYFIASAGLHNTAFQEELDWSSTLKSIGFSLYSEGRGGVHTSLFFLKGEYSFSISLVYEPF